MNKFKSRKALAAVIAGVLVVGGGWAAIASAQSDSSSPQAFFDAVAKHLGISSEELEDATKAAAIDQVDAALAEGKITEEQAERMKERIESGEAPPFFGPRFFGEHRGFHLHAPGDQLSAAADYLGLSLNEVRERLRDGQSLADVAEAEDKSVEGLEQAMVDAAKKNLDEAVSEGNLTREQADDILERIEARIDDIVEGSVEAWRGRFRGPPGGPAGGAPFWGTAA
jgi:hypothetical protein